jgi:hypothetical protein
VHRVDVEELQTVSALNKTEIKPFVFIRRSMLCFQQECTTTIIVGENENSTQFIKFRLCELKFHYARENRKFRLLRRNKY